MQEKFVINFHVVNFFSDTLYSVLILTGSGHAPFGPLTGICNVIRLKYVTWSCPPSTASNMDKVSESLLVFFTTGRAF